MKVILTGPLARHCGTPLTLKKLYAQYAGIEGFLDGYKELGIEVEFAKPGQDLLNRTDYDLVLFCAADLRNLAAGFGLQTMLTVKRLEDAGRPVAAYWDDAMAHQVRLGIGAFAGRPERIRSRMRVANQWARPWVDENAEELADYLKGWAEGGWSVPACGFFYKWGNLASYERSAGCKIQWRLDQTHMMGVPYKPITQEREKRWFLASFRDVTKWANKLGTQWPVDLLIPDKRKNKEKRSEDEVQKMAARDVGVLSYPIPEHPDCGIFRVRTLRAARSGTVLWGDPTEFCELGGPYLTPLAKIEAMTPSQLAWHAAEQHDWLMALVGKRDEFITTLADMTETLTGKPVIRTVDSYRSIP